MKSWGARAAAGLGFALGAAVLSAEPSWAQAPPSLAELCAGSPGPPGFAPAVLEIQSRPEFPEADASDESEGWVRIGFTIDASGETKDIVVLDHIGTRSMLKAARLAIARWKYKPATENGAPVAQYANAAEILYRAQNVGNTAIHDAVITRFDEGRALVAGGKYAEGIAVLEQAFELPLTLYEQAKVSFALAFAYEKSADVPRALEHARHALIEGGSFLEKAVVPAAQRLRLRLEAANGNYHAAACAPLLPPSDAFDPTGADRRLTMQAIETAKKKLASAEPLTIDATLSAKPAGADGGAWEHPLTRRTFKFASTSGTLDKFQLVCLRQNSVSAVDTTSLWAVPEAVGPCTLRLAGAVGATARLVEEW